MYSREVGLVGETDNRVNPVATPSKLMRGVEKSAPEGRERKVAIPLLMEYSVLCCLKNKEY